MHQLFDLHAPYQPMGDQPQAIRELVDGVRAGNRHQVLLGATGTGKTFTMANIIQELQIPAVVMAHNKTLAAQLYAEFKEFFPNNAVEYFVSYYDYYQPEAYVPRRDLYIEKEVDTNDEIDRLRLAATAALSSRSDVIIIASVSCIYGLGDPEAYGKAVITLKTGAIHRRNALLRNLIENRYERNDTDFHAGTFRVRGDTLDIYPAYEDSLVYRISYFDDEIEKITAINPLTGEVLRVEDEIQVFPAKHYITEESRMKQALADIEAELAERIRYFKDRGMFLEAQRIEQRTNFDLEMIRATGYCAGIENYSRHIDQRAPGSHPWTLMDYLPSNYLLFIDESHMTVPQIRGMYNGDRARKQILSDYGFRLPSAMDNRPLTFEEFEGVMGTTIYTSATPGPYELARTELTAEQIIRPTGLLDPVVEVRPIEGQIDDLIHEIRIRTEKNQRVLVTTLTKRMAEDLTDYLKDNEIKVQYLHSEVDTLERISILRDMRLGTYDVIVGINLLREGLDLPEVSLVAILDADKEGFLRSGVSLIQTIGRAARNAEGKVLMYADKVTDSMRYALDETARRRKKQQAYNEAHQIQPMTIMKGVYDLSERLTTSAQIAEDRAEYRAAKKSLPTNELKHTLAQLEREMKEAAKNLEFERAAELRDSVYELRGMLADVTNASPWQRARLMAGEVPFK